jgi:hypothetical protein
LTIEIDKNSLVLDWLSGSLAENAREEAH